MDLRGKQGQTTTSLYFIAEPKGENRKDFKRAESQISALGGRLRNQGKSL